MNRKSLIFGREEEKYSLGLLDSIFIKHRGYKLRLPQKGEAVVLLLSGGIDSVSLWNLLLDKYKLNVYPIYFQSSDFRIRFFQKLAIKFASSFFKQKYPKLFHQVVVRPNPIRFSLMNSLGKKYQEKISRNLRLLIPNLYRLDKNKNIATLICQPSRLGHYLFGAFDYLNQLRYEHDLSVDTLIISLTPEDASLLRESTQAALRSMNLSLCVTLGDYSYQVLAPIEKEIGFHYTKFQLVSQAVKSGVPVQKTWSCVGKGIFHCGKCYNCYERMMVLGKVGIKDTTRYDPRLIPLRKLAVNIKTLLARQKVFVRKEKNSDIKIEKNSLFRLKDDIIVDKVFERYFMRNLRTGETQEINKTAWLIVNFLKTGKYATRQMISMLKKHYPGAQESVLSKDVDQFIYFLIKESAIKADSDS